MTKFILYIATSIDGYIARPDGSIDWLPTPDLNGEDFGCSKFYNSINALVMGSTTYEQALGFGDWAYSGKLSYVLTSRDLSTTLPDICFIQGGVEAVVEAIKQAGYERVWLMGGGKLVSSFMSKGLIDEYIITVIPTILGSGISLYQSGLEFKLDLINVTPYSAGVVELHYQNR